VENKRLLTEHEIINLWRELNTDEANYFFLGSLYFKVTKEDIALRDSQDAKSYVAGRHDAAVEIFNDIEDDCPHDDPIIHTHQKGDCGECVEELKSKYGVK
jgi:hypothetical protein